jgi:hypothetical protein
VEAGAESRTRLAIIRANAPLQRPTSATRDGEHFRSSSHIDVIHQPLLRSRPKVGVSKDGHGRGVRVAILVFEMRTVVSNFIRPSD